MDSTLLLLRVVVMSALVAGLAYATARLLRRRTQLLQRGGSLEVIDAIALGARQQLALVRAGRRVICVGISSDGICRLAEFRGADAEALLETAARQRPDLPAGGNLLVFADSFRQVLRRKTENGQGRS